MADNNNEPAVTVESLQLELNTERTAHQATKDSLAVALDEKAKAEGALSQAAEIIAGQRNTITEQEARIVQLQTKPAEFASITVDKAEYEVRAKKFKYKGVDYGVDQLLENKKLQKELVGLGVGFLVKKEA